MGLEEVGLYPLYHNLREPSYAILTFLKPGLIINDSITLSGSVGECQ